MPSESRLAGQPGPPSARGQSGRGVDFVETETKELST